MGGFLGGDVPRPSQRYVSGMLGAMVRLCGGVSARAGCMVVLRFTWLGVVRELRRAGDDAGNREAWSYEVHIVRGSTQLYW